MERKRKTRPQIHDFSEIVIGARFWRLTVTEIRSWQKYGSRLIVCKCDCWKIVETSRYNIAHWQESCSCKQYEDNRKLAYKHWMGGTWKWWRHNRFYNIYANITQRTNWKIPNERSKCYEWVKNLWNSFEEFKNDMYESYLDHVAKFWEKETTIDRIDPSWNYCKENCRRATIKEQWYNKKTTVKAIIGWKEMNSWDVMELLWVSRHTAITYLRNN